ncbi:hypothetical protein F11_15490 [Rhodospirillum rubrum F11]|uniref:Coenzyme PQQ synthesis D n=1 Tax=Rhodospirillum rubrum (strain ATCC 11170 / ATH 1.1.1 / DSM 467 / LMG 4362 / NCIMB 8255 / S1) TaxID=269796 RepID=Q2RPX5_RHORT|nr:PqqD family protein [Rhodospirillum rubrum]ABC23820.1 conserved hypothetical protein [Rhodospirillum rubrum ATCC 11170]AEO49560.1 hypothetical protein F11_15490 [Rhodospirillum rubrum F11]MBK5955497.1 PqqD family protein [Rhodospirillum rubrum]QXG82437.1 PqqD family protein [Rhodospirillum rubrum]HAQ00254.1 PqqD family protein [Rhodospirillum rubrum]
MTTPEPLTPGSLVGWHPEQVTAAVDGEVIVMGLIRGQYVGLDDIGSVLWTLLEQPRTVRQLCDDLGRRYQGDPATMSADVVAFLEDLRALDLIEVLDAAPLSDP